MRTADVVEQPACRVLPPTRTRPSSTAISMSAAGARRAPAGTVPLPHSRALTPAVACRASEAAARPGGGKSFAAAGEFSPAPTISTRSGEGSAVASEMTPSAHSLRRWRRPAETLRDGHLRVARRDVDPRPGALPAEFPRALSIPRGNPADPGNHRLRGRAGCADPGGILLWNAHCSGLFGGSSERGRSLLLCSSAGDGPAGPSRQRRIRGGGQASFLRRRGRS
jgi:hypothetical protein